MSISMQRRQFLIGSGAVVTVSAFAAACGGPYVGGWDLPRAPGATDQEPIVTTLRYGITAPSAHNTQPWRLELVSDREARIFTDPERLLPRTDPPARQIHISHGTLLETTAIAATALGLRAEIDVLPEGEVLASDFGTKPTAQLRLVDVLDVPVDPLFRAIALRRTSRLSHTGGSVSADNARGVIHAARRAGVKPLVFRSNLGPLKAIARRAMALEVEDARLYGETRKWFRFSAEEVRSHGDGLNLETTGADSLAARIFLNAENFQSESNRQRFLENFYAAINTTQAFFALSTPTNTMHDWLATGRSYVRAQLAAALAGLSMHPVSQSQQELPQMQGIGRELAALTGVAPPGKLQMLVRLGRTESPARSPRRPLSAMLAPSPLHGKLADDARR
ncbi:MAG TPA: hypothetical protein PKA88_05640 [Polyangiaceae bacterium]|nr:hypothetical protein [Polyangiaceae bacterium]HMR76122.1 hypothetical protein [Polyangiaceae bacterium]